jgi:hypothetical protein
MKEPASEACWLFQFLIRIELCQSKVGWIDERIAVFDETE